MQAFEAMMRSVGVAQPPGAPNALADRLTGTETPDFASASAGGMPDLASMLGGGAGADNANPLAQMMAALGGDPAASAAMMPQEPPRPKSWVDRVLPLVHLFTMLGLAIFAVFVYEPAKRQDILTLSGADAVDDGLGLRGSISWRGWARLAGERGRVGPSAQGVPIKDSVVGLLSGGGLAVVVRERS